ncbi:MAG: hypothetical protein Q9225_000778 [Loekoesia sp. 1 TL-2023]
MVSRKEDTTDDTSIKPVSSLRSHFERISHHDHSPRSPQRTKIPDSLLQTRPPDSDVHRNERLSLDAPRSSTSTSHSNPSGTHESHQNALDPTKLAPRPLHADSLRHGRPISSHPLVSPRYSPPRIAGQPPISPLRVNGAINGGSTASASHSLSGGENQQDQVLGPSAPTLAPIPNRTRKPELKSQQISRPGCRTSISESRISFQTPTAYGSSAVTNAQQRLEANGSVIDDRTSPFGTPPSSDDSQDANYVGRTASTEAQHSSSQVTDMSVPRAVEPPFRPSFGKLGKAEYPEPQQSPTLSLTSKPGPNTSVRNIPERRPALPPRPDIASRFPATKVHYAPVFRYAKASKGRGAVLELGQPTPTVDPAMQQSHSLPAKPLQHDPSLSPSRTLTRTFAANGPTANQPLRITISESDSNHHESNQALTGASYSPDVGASQSGFYTIESPDWSHSNRRPPYTRSGNHAVYANYDTKIFDICAGKACSAGQLTRAWDLSSGRMVLSLTLGEREARVTAIAFKPASKTDEEGSRLWVGTNYGDLHEVNITRHKIVSSRLNAHSGREVVRIHRYQNKMWTLDEDGSLYVWPPDNSGLPTLESSPITRKLPRGHTFSVVIRGVLWVAVGKELQIFRPSADELEDFKPAQQPSSQPGVGEITSGAVIGDQLDKVYFSHSDGKITTYSVADYKCLGIINASVYKINCLVGAGSRLWAGYNTGKICIYDTQSRPWRVMKEWQAHEGPVTNLSVDQTGLWVSGLLRVGSISLDNTIKLWDGLLEEDWLESEIQANDTSWCNFQEIEAVVMTWNAGASTPASLRYEDKDSNMLRLVLQPGKAPDLLIFGFQELVDLEDKRLTASL